MKRKTLNTLFTLLCIFLFASCGESESGEYCSDPEASCPDETAIEATICCTDADCYMTYNGSKYDCDGDDCSAIQTSIIEKACSSGDSTLAMNINDINKLKAQMEAVTKQLLIEARSASGCNF
jgi:hypothetical protein